MSLWTAREVADELAVTTDTVLRWTREGTLPAFRLPSGALRYEPDAIRAWLKERATAPEDSASHLAEPPPRG